MDHLLHRCLEMQGKNTWTNMVHSSALEICISQIELLLKSELQIKMMKHVFLLILVYVVASIKTEEHLIRDHTFRMTD